MKRLAILIICISGLFIHCGNSEAGIMKVSDNEPVKRDESITSSNAFADLFLDSLMLEGFIKEHEIAGNVAQKMRDFYNSRNFQFAWFTEDGVAEQTLAFWNMHQNFVNYTRDSSIYDKELHQQMELIVDGEEELNLSNDKLLEIELHLTQHFFDFSRYAYTGKTNPEQLQWHIPRKKVDAVALLDSLIQSNGRDLEQWEPVNKQYRQLKNKLLEYYAIEKNGGWPEISLGKLRVLKNGDSASIITDVKKRLQETGDFPQESLTPFFDATMESAVKQFQLRHGLTRDGVIGPAFMKAINVSVKEKIEQLLINMERMRWMPAQPAGKRIVTNIPEFKLYVYEGEKPVLSMDVVVGKSATRTVVFSDELQYVVFSPYWNVPRSIIRNEILPAMNRNPNYLASKNMEITGRSNGLSVIRQKPGGNNALGRVKFIFPNRYSIYFHDTPAKSLFDRERRAFSHGCIRLADPFGLAQYLLKDKEGWTENRIREAMNAGTEKWVTLDEKIPVFISYFTAFVDDNGLLHFREDIYGHDKKTAKHLFQHASQ